MPIDIRKIELDLEISSRNWKALCERRDILCRAIYSGIIPQPIKRTDNFWKWICRDHTFYCPVCERKLEKTIFYNHIYICEHVTRSHLVCPNGDYESVVEGK